VIAYRAMLDVPRELVRYLTGLLAAERRRLGTRRGTRKLTCWYQAILVLVWFRKGEDKTLLGAGFGVSRATAYRYVAEGIKVLAAKAPDLHEALKRVADEGWSHIILDGKLFATDGLAETTTSVKGATIDAWYSGKHRDFGANIQALFRPDGLPVWTSDALPGHLHDLSCAQAHDITGALYFAASQLDLPTLADSGYEGVGHGIHTPYKQPANDSQLAIDNRTYNALLRSLRCLGERGFAILTGQWYTLRHITASPRSTGDIVRAALVLTQFEYRTYRILVEITSLCRIRILGAVEQCCVRSDPE
jgi:DDE superfamily endonuclease/Helix-turn-helix of DDE superfamily endonuclease